MHKRKASADGSNRQKAVSRRTSAASVAKNNNADQQRQNNAQKCPSTQNVLELEQGDSPKIKKMNKGVEVCMPKTRFTSKDRSRSRVYSSPRLKSFPIERARKLESPPPFSPQPITALITQQNPCETGTLYMVPDSDHCHDKGQGDAATGAQSLPHRQENLLDRSSMSQQQVSSNQVVHPMYQPNPNSESMLAQQTMSCNAQVHRPFVPNMSHGVGVHRFSPRKFQQEAGTPLARLPPNMPNSQSATLEPPVKSSQIYSNQPKCNINPENEECNNQSKVTDKMGPCTNCEKQPIGGRNGVTHRSILRNQQAQAQEDQNVSTQLLRENHHLPPVPWSNNYPRHARVDSHIGHQHPQQIYQQLQHNIAEQQQMQQRALNHQFQMITDHAQQQRNQEIYYSNQVQYPRNYYFVQGMTSPQDANINLIRNVRNAYGHAQQNFPMNLAQNQQALAASQNQQQLAQQPIAMNQQNLMCQRFQKPQTEPSFNQQRLSQQQSNNPSAVAHVRHQSKRSGNKQSLPFTPEMIRDQELLVLTMKQQGIPGEIMRRQFDSLLNEQRKHLMYVSQFREEKESAEEKRAEVPVQRRKKTDEKPEWMMHLTPTRMSYLEIEKLRRESGDEEERKLNEDRSNQQEEMQKRMTNQEINQIDHRDASSHLIQPNRQQGTHENMRYNPNWQNPRGVPMYSYNNQNLQNTMWNNMNTLPAPVYRPPQLIHQNQYYQYPSNIPNYQHMQHPHSQQQPYSYINYENPQNPGKINMQNSATPENEACRDSKRNVEPCSLSKMKLYKTIIRPQKSNNGLQDFDVLKRSLDALKDAESMKTLEYLENLSKRTAAMKLNGIQDPSEVHPDLQQPPMVNIPKTGKRTVANGLENTRNPDNPPQPRLYVQRSEQGPIAEYPRQRQNNRRNCYSIQAERENGIVAMPPQSSQSQPFSFDQHRLQGFEKSNTIPFHERNPVAARNYSAPFKFDAPRPQYNQQTQQYYYNMQNLARNNGEGDVFGEQRRTALKEDYSNRADGDACETAKDNEQRETGKKVAFQVAPNMMQGVPNNYGYPGINETRTIGGITYLARKPNFIPNSQTVSPDALGASRHLEPPTIIY